MTVYADADGQLLVRMRPTITGRHRRPPPERVIWCPRWYGLQPHEPVEITVEMGSSEETR